MGENKMDITELNGVAIINAIINMLQQLKSDNNEINYIEEISLQRIFDEIDSLDLKFDKNGGIIV